MPKILLLWDFLKSHPNSMDRYAAKLSNQLTQFGIPDWSFIDIIPNEITLFGKSKYNISVCNKIDDYLNRFIFYPIKAFNNYGDIYHIIDHGYAHLAYFLKRRPLIITCHDLMTFRLAAGDIPGFHCSNSSFRKFRWIVNGLHAAKAIIADSICTKNDIIRFLGISEIKIQVIPQGIDNAFRIIYDIDKINNFKIKYNIPEKSKVILHISANGSYKNIDGLIKALSRMVHGVGIDCFLVRIGDSLIDRQWKLATELGVDHNICELRNITDQELVIAYNQADILLFPSWWEGFGLPPLEAMACGTPAVVSNRGSLPEIVGDAGVIIEPDDYQGMAEAFKRILVDEEWRKTLIAKGVEHAARFSWENVATQTLKVYEDVLSSSTKR